MLALDSGPAASSNDMMAPALRSASTPLVSMQPRKDLRCYDVLGVSRFATPTEIRHAYRQKALSYHPDKSAGQLAGFLSLAEAFEVLSDAVQRGAYDRELAAANSRDGVSGMEIPLAATVSLHRDPIILCLALVEIPCEEWPKHIADVPTATLKEMHEHLVESSVRGGIGVKRSRLEGDGSAYAEDFSDVKPRHLCCGANKKRGYFCAQIQMCGIHIRTFSSRNMITAAENHLALVSLKETFFAKWKENGMADFDEVLRAAAVDARSQKMYFPDAMHWFEKAVEPEPGLKWRLTTPCTRDLESTLRNRSEVLSLLNRGAPKSALQKSIDRMREMEQDKKTAREEVRPAIEERLHGFVQCELEHRMSSNGYSSRKRQRLRGKQSMTQLCVQLPWFGRFAAQQGISSTELEAMLPPLQTRLRGVPSLEQCLQRALRNSLFASGQPAALEDLSRVTVSGGAAAGPRRKTNSSHAAIALGNIQSDQQFVQPAAASAELPAAAEPDMQFEADPALLMPPPQHYQHEPWQLPELQPEPPLLQPQPPPQQPPQQLPPQQPPPRAEELHHSSKQPPSEKLEKMREPGGKIESVEELVPIDTSVEGSAEKALRPLRLPGGCWGLATAAEDGREASPGRTAREVSPVSRSQQSRSRPRRGWRECYSFILQELLADPEVDRLFGQPVDLEMYPDYLSRISPNTPVDLRLILHKLGQEENGYADVDECSADVSMVWENAARFNAPGSYVRAIAEQAAKIINDLLIGRRSVGRIWCRAPSQGHSSLRPQTRSRSETRSRSQLSVQFGGEATPPEARMVKAPQ